MLSNLTRQVLVGGQNFAESDKRADNADIDLDSLLAPQDGRQHGNPMLRKNPRELAPSMLTITH